MTKTLYKNLISFILMCAIVVSCCVALLAVTDSFNDGIMGASLTATKHWYGDEIYARTSDQIDTHTCTQDGDGSDYSIPHTFIINFFAILVILFIMTGIQNKKNSGFEALREI